MRRRRRLPPRPDVPRSGRRADRTPWIVAIVFGVGALVAAQIVVTAPPGTISAAPSASHGAEPVDARAVPTDPDGPYSFLEATYVDGVRVPVRWNPCQPVEYELHLVDTPPAPRRRSPMRSGSRATRPGSCSVRVARPRTGCAH